MMLGKIVGRTTTMDFQFLVKGPAKKFDYVWIPSKDCDVLAQIIEIEKSNEESIAYCNIIGYRDGILKHLRIPLEPGNEVLKAEDVFIKKTLGLEEVKNGAFVGHLNGYDSLRVLLDLNKLLTKHIAVLAKSGSGKSYTVAVLIEEILEKEIPVLVIDPHGEYSSLKYKNEKDDLKLKKFKIEPKSYSNNVQEYSPDIENNPSSIPLKLNAYNLNSSELVHLLPAKLSNTQQGLLYSGLRNMKDRVDFDSLINELELEENNAKYTLINLIEFIQKLNLFSNSPTSLQELIQPGKCTIINLKGIQTELQEVVVYKLMKDLFEARKKSDIPPFFAIIEEAHNYIPERNFGEAKSSSILRQISSEGRKFGLGLCLHPKTQIQCNPDVKEIMNVKQGEKVITFNLNKKKLETESIVNTIEVNPSEYNMKVFKLETESGRSIIVSGEHPFLTKEGWKKVSDLNSNDLVGICPMPSLMKGNSNKRILSILEVKKKLKTHIQNKKRTWNQYDHNDILERMEKFASIKYSDKEALVLARIVGHILSDGCLKSNKKSVTFYLDSLQSASEVKKDLTFLGVSHGKTEKIIGNWGTEYRVECTVKPFWILLVSLGCPIGKKTRVEYLTPNWIKNGTKPVKREFLSALFGGDGSPSEVVDRKRRRISYLCFSKERKLKNNGIEYVNELEKLFNLFGIKTNSFTIKKNKRKIYSFVLKINSERDNTIRLFEDIGVRYTFYKKDRINKTLEYIRYQENVLKQRKKKISRIKNLLKKGFSINSIAKTLNEDWHTIDRVIKGTYNLSMNKREEVLPFSDWIKKRYSKGIIWENIVRKKEIQYGGKLLDIETERNHNFIANSFITHNCLITQRPSRIDKSALSQCTTQIILKVTNPGDIKAIANSVEGLTSETEKEIKNIPIGTAMITGVVDLPLFVDIRPRKTKHGGEAVNMIEAVAPKRDFLDEAKNFEKKNGELLNVILPRNSKKDIELMSDKKIKEIKTNLIPCLFVNCNDFNLLVNLNTGELVKDVNFGRGTSFTPKIDLSPQQKRVFDAALTMNTFTSAEIFSKTGLQFSDVYDVVMSLVKKGYVVQEGNKYKLSQPFSLKLHEYACYVSPDFSRVEYDNKLEKKYNSEEVLRFLENLTKIKSSKECYLVVYDVKYC